MSFANDQAWQKKIQHDGLVVILDMRTGKVLKIGCALCARFLGDEGISQIVKHHLSYRPERVMFCCRSCHFRIHQGSFHSELLPIDEKFPES